jgi:Spy/CpxP family protein refolding chaperone
MQRLAPVFLFVLTFVLGGLLEAAPVHASDAKIIDARADAPKMEAPKAPIPGGPNDESALWWDDPAIVKALSLTDEQRKKMGEILKAYRKKVPQNQRPEAFHETLVQGNWKAARSESEKVAKNAETSVQMRGTLKIDVLSLLSKEQRETLVDRYPRLIYRPWRRAMRGASPR